MRERHWDISMRDFFQIKAIKVKDVDFKQTALTSNFVDRYNRLMNGASWAQKYANSQNTSAYDVARKELFRDYELMDADPIISSALDIYCDESTVDNIENRILKNCVIGQKVLELGRIRS